MEPVDFPVSFFYTCFVFVKEAGKMSLGNSLFHARKKSGLSQEAVAEKLGVSRQTISKWELDETLPDIGQSKKLSVLYHVTLDEEKQKEVDWTKVWAKKYPILEKYRQEVNTQEYDAALQTLLQKLQTECGYGDEDAFLVLKDILAQVWNKREK